MKSVFEAISANSQRDSNPRPYSLRSVDPLIELGDVVSQHVWVVVLAGRLLSSRKQHAEADAHYERAISNARRTKGEDHPDVAAGLANLALSKKHQGDMRSAVELSKQALAARKASHGQVRAKARARGFWGRMGLD